MSERKVRRFLASLRQIVRTVQLYPVGHPLTDEATAAGTQAATAIVDERGEVVLTLLDDAFYLDRALLAHTSLEMNGLLREMQGRGIDSITFISPLHSADIFELGMFVAGISDDVPASGTVRLNERPLSSKDLENSELSGLRRSYASSLDVLRSVGVAVRSGGEFELSGAMWAVENLVEQSVAQPGTSLLLATVKGHDEYTFYHSVNTCIMSLAMGRLLELDESLLLPMGVGALLHDIGKVGVSQSVLQNPGRLDSEQWAVVKRHPQEGAQAILAAAGAGQELAANIAFEHHARFDGSGYPKATHNGHHDHGGGHGHERGAPTSPLHLFSRLVSIADTYDAITTRRAYRRAETPNRALRVLLNGAGTSYDPDFVRAFIHMMGVYPPGSLLEMDDGTLTMVTHHPDDDPSRALAVVVRSAAGEFLDVPESIALDPDAVREQVLPNRAGVDPAELLEKVGPVGVAA